MYGRPLQSPKYHDVWTCEHDGRSQEIAHTLPHIAQQIVNCKS